MAASVTRAGDGQRDRRQHGNGCRNGTGGAGGSATPGVYAPAPPALRLLTVAQYQNSMRALLGSTITLPADLELDTVLNGFASIGASKIDLSPLAVEQLESAALAAAKQALSDTANRGTLVGCTPAGTTDDTCARSFVRSFGRRAWRRPLTDEEVNRYAGIATNAGTMLGNFYGGLEYALAGLLQSPHFIYRTEIGEPDPQDASRRVLSGYEVATRLSYFLSATTPDDVLLDAAAGGSLTMPDGLRSAAQRLVDAPAARTASQSFFTELLRLDELNNLSQLPSIFPAAMSTTLGASMRTETLRVLEDIAFTRDADYRTLFDTTDTFVNGELAKIYGLMSPTGTSFAATTLAGSGPRAGILGQAGFLAMTSHPNATSPTRRGKFIREVFLCQSVDPPPPDVDPTFPPDPNGPLTARQRLASHSQNDRCATCHGFLDPIGLGLENFDGIGAYRTQDAGQTIDASGDARRPGLHRRARARRRAQEPPRSRHLSDPGRVPLRARPPRNGGRGSHHRRPQRQVHDRRLPIQSLLLETVVSAAFRQVGKLD